LKDRLYKTVVGEILALIDQGTFPPGSRLPGERDLAERFNVSRVTIREAEIALEALGNIVIKTGSGAYVLRGSRQAPDGLPDVTAFELTAARSVIEAETAALAAVNITDAGIAELRELVAAMAEAGHDDTDDHDEIDRRFHITIARLSGNPVMEYAVKSLWRMRNELPKVKNVYSSVCVSDSAARTNEHAAVVDALSARDPAAARTAMREHFQRLFEAMISATEHTALEEVRRRIGEDRKRFLVTTQI
jgi:DNA-binding FadR family transcriptional regulator